MDRPRALWLGFLGVWTLTLLYFGAVRPWAVMTTCAATALLLLREPLRLSRWGAGLLLAFGCLFALQLLPLPFLFPYTTRLRELHEVGVWWPGTADTGRTLLFLARFASCAMAGLLVLKLRQSGLRTLDFLHGVLGVLALEAAFGIVRVFAGWPNPPFHAGPSSGADSAAGTLVNRNHFAGLMAMGLVLASALAAARFTRPGRRLEAGLGWACLAGLFAVAIVLSRSRGGALAALSGLALLPFFHRGKASAAGVAVLAAVAVVAVVAANPAGLLARFDALDPFELSADQRWQLWSTTFSGALHQPVLGFGVGTHATAYHPFQPPALAGQPEHAHNDYVDFLFEAGFAGLGLGLAPSLAERRGCPQTLRRATLAVGGRSTGSHAHRRTSATELKNRLYWGYAKEGLPAVARPKAGAKVGLPPAAGRTSRPRTSPDSDAAILALAGGKPHIPAEPSAGSEDSVAESCE